MLLRFAMFIYDWNPIIAKLVGREHRTGQN